MANLPETPQWEDGIYQIEVSDPVLGGPDGISNRQAKQLASRTSYLKQQVEKGGSDLEKHIEAADPHTQYAPKANPTFTGAPAAPTVVKADNSTKLATTAHVKSVVADYAPLASPTLSGTPTAPTAAQSTNNTQLATTAFVQTALVALIGGAPVTLDTLKEIATAINNDPNFSTTINTALALKAPLASPALTGAPTAPTPENNDNSKKLATTEFVAKALATLVDNAPEALNTLKELANALGNDPNFATTVLKKLAEKLAKDQNGADIADPILFVKNLGLSDGNYVGRLLSSPKVFTSSGTYTPTPGAKRIRITMTGGGGGGGGCQASANNETYFGAGGGAGATVISMFTLTGAANYPLVIASGGTGGAAAANGSNGGTTSFSTIFSAPGGEGGGKSSVSNTNGGAGGVPTSGDIRLIGGCGGDGQSGLIAVTGQGGVSYFGGGGRAGAGSGVNGTAPGSGGGGAYDSAYSGIAMKGGTGASGIMIIEEFA